MIDAPRSCIDIDVDAVKKFNETTPDWEAICPVCGVRFSGTIAQLKEHKHGCD